MSASADQGVRPVKSLEVDFLGLNGRRLDRPAAGQAEQGRDGQNDGSKKTQNQA